MVDNKIEYSSEHLHGLPTTIISDGKTELSAQAAEALERHLQTLAESTEHVKGGVTYLPVQKPKFAFVPGTGKIFDPARYSFPAKSDSD